MGWLRNDPGFSVVAALEVFDEATQTAAKAPVFSRRLLAPREPVTAVERPEEALAVCLDERGGVDMATIAGLLGCSPEQARDRLGRLVYDDPDSGQAVPAAQYLSGNVREKLALARQAAADDPRWQVNVAALEAVQPRDLEPSEIDARLGAPWFPPHVVAQFCAEVLATSVDVEYVAATGTWALQARAGRWSVALTSEWGTPQADGVRLVQDAANQWPTTVSTDGNVDLAATLAAREKQERIVERFASWVWEDPARAERLAGEYNARFNSVVLPSYDGSHLSFPGLAESFRPHRHQRDAVWRMLSERTTLLAHDVGAGKTATMVMGVQEMCRLGMVQKPMVVVPNHMLDQFSREWQQLYPAARLLVADKDDVSPAERKSFIARCASQDWDAVIITQSSFERVNGQVRRPAGGQLNAPPL